MIQLEKEPKEVPFGMDIMVEHMAGWGHQYTKYGPFNSYKSAEEWIIKQIGESGTLDDNYPDEMNNYCVLLADSSSIAIEV